MNKNSSIKCSVANCKYNVKTEGYCSLDVVKIGTHEANPTKCECTDCNSFVLDNQCPKKQRSALWCRPYSLIIRELQIHIPLRDSSR